MFFNNINLKLRKKLLMKKYTFACCSFILKELSNYLDFVSLVCKCNFKICKIIIKNKL